MIKSRNSSIRQSQVWSRGGFTPPVPDTNTIDIVYKWVDWTDGVSNPNFRSQINRGENATTPYKGKKRVINIVSGVHHDLVYKLNSTGAVFTSSINGTANYILDQVISTFDSATSGVAMQRFLNKINGAAVPFTGLVFLGELVQNLRMIKNASFLFSAKGTSYLSRLKRVWKAKPSVKRKELASAWLELQFGWLPLIKDIEVASSLYNTALRKSGLIQISAGNESRTYSENAGGTNFYGQSQYHERVLKETITNSVRHRGAISVSALGSRFPDELSKKFGLTIEAFVPALWELLPYSFLLDYFTNIGDVIQNGFTPVTAMAWHWRTRKYEKIQEVYFKNRPDLTAAAHASSGNTVLSDAGYNQTDVTIVDTNFERDVPNLSVSLGFRDTITVGKIANIAALLAQGKRLQSLT